MLTNTSTDSGLWDCTENGQLQAVNELPFEIDQSSCLFADAQTEGLSPNEYCELPDSVVSSECCNWNKRHVQKQHLMLG